jgi:aminoglycoside phosphotransferase family enzyme
MVHQDTQETAAESATLHAKVAALCNPEIYQDRCQRVDTIETHMSWIFLTEHLVYKLKKPLLRSFINLSRCADRRLNSWQELVLNQRLAPHVYLAVLPLTGGPRGTLQLNGAGPVVDWLVKMRRLPADLMLDRLIKDRKLSESDLSRFLSTVVDFYLRCARSTITPEAYLQRLKTQIQSEQQQLLDPNLQLPEGSIDHMAAELVKFVDSDAAALEARVNSGLILEGHGDLRPEHICLTEPVVVFDCLEFSQDLRILDTADELAFLFLECTKLSGGDAVAHAIKSIYTDMTADKLPWHVLQFYMAKRAMLRAKLAIWHIYDCPPRDHARWRSQALAYLRTVEDHLGRM